MNTLAKAVGWEQVSIFDSFNLSSAETNLNDISGVVKGKTAKTLKLLSLFSGIGAFEKALTRQDISYEVVNYCEIDKYASKAYSLVHNVPEELNLWDVRNVHKVNIPKGIDIMTWAFPCGDISISGKQKGFIDENGNLTRSGLYYEGIRILREVMPKFSLVENVKALISKKFSKEFNMILKDLDDAGYNTYRACYNAAEFGVAQHRERVYIVSIRKDIDNGKFGLMPYTDIHPAKLKDFLFEGPIESKHYINEKLLSNFREKLTINKNTNIISLGQVSNDGSQAGKVYSIYGNFPTLCACTHGYALGYIMIGKLIRRLLPIECGRLMGFDDFDIIKCMNAGISDTQMYKMLGNSIVVNVLEYIFMLLFSSFQDEAYCL